MSYREIKAHIPEDVTLIAVSKTQSAEAIEALINQGHKVFGENLIQEAKEKFIPLKEKYPDIELHFIGHLQSNKAKDAVALFDYIHSIDSKKLAKTVSEEMKKQNKQLPCFIQVNTGDEKQKGGIDISELEDLYKYCTQELKMGIKGLMCLPPIDDVADIHFALLHKLASKMNLKDLSIGMSADYKSALKFGATYIRIGSAIFGDRK